MRFLAPALNRSSLPSPANPLRDSAPDERNSLSKKVNIIWKQTCLAFANTGRESINAALAKAAPDLPTGKKVARRLSGDVYTTILA